MKKACAYCGKIHDYSYICPSKPVRDKKPTYIDKFRWSKAWQYKREKIRQRDNYLCQQCLANNIYTYNDIQVHHIEPIIEAWDRRLDDDNLICLCPAHHELAESGEINRKVLHNMIKNSYNAF